MCELEVDASVSRKYNEDLIGIHEQLSSSDFKTLKFLCKGIVPLCSLESMESALDLFMELERQNKISNSPYNVEFLAKLLLLIGRKDLVRRFLVSAGESSETNIDPFRIQVLFRISQELTRSDVNELLFLCDDNKLMFKSDRLKIKDSEDFLSVLEQKLGSEEKILNKLESLFTSMKRNDILQIILAYKNQFNIQTNQNDPRQILNINDRTTGTSNKRRGTLEADIIPGCFGGSDNWESLPNISVSERSAQESQELGISRYGGTFRSGSMGEYNTFDDNEEQQLNMIGDSSLDMPKYNMSSRPRGICLIVNNKTFRKIESDPESRSMPNREGTDKDKDSLIELFTKKLHFKVIAVDDLSHEDILLQMKMVASEDHSDYDCFASCILSHGAFGAVYGVNGRTVEIKKIMEHFKGNSCPSLKGKPKMFFIQACQGKEKQIGCPLEIDGPATMGLKHDFSLEPTIETIPNEADFLLSYATVPGFVSFRSKSQGSWYINALVDCLNRFADRYDLLTILIKVNEEIGKPVASMKDGQFKQSPAPMATLRKRIFFR